jgi:SOS-response transcriptional repressor LexA
MQTNIEPMADSNLPAGVSVHRGFPNPAADKTQPALALDFNQLLVQHPSSTFLFRIAGHQWIEQGVFDGDIAIIDRALTPQKHDIVLLWQDENFELHRRNDITNTQHIWGVVSAIIHPRRIN